MSVIDSLALVFVECRRFTNFILRINDCAHGHYSSMLTPYTFSRILSTAATIPSAATKTIFTFTEIATSLFQSLDICLNFRIHFA